MIVVTQHCCDLTVGDACWSQQSWQYVLHECHIAVFKISFWTAWCHQKVWFTLCFACTCSLCTSMSLFPKKASCLCYCMLSFIMFIFKSCWYTHGRTGQPGNLAVARWAGWFAGQVGRHVKCWSRSNEKNSWSLYIPLIPKFKSKVLSDLLNPQTSYQPPSFVILLIHTLVICPVNRGRTGRERREGTSRQRGTKTQREEEGSWKCNMGGARALN